MDHVWLNILSVLLIFTLAIISPGPNFILVVNTALSKSRRNGVYTAFGVATGSGLFALAGLLGLILIINSLPYFSLLVRFLGGGYLVYLGITMLLQKTKHHPIVNSHQQPSFPEPGKMPSFMRGLLTNLTNPKAWAFYFSLFTLVVKPGFPFWAKGFLCLSMFSISLFWYIIIALLISDRRLQKNFFRVQSILNVVLGSFLIYLGSKLLLKN